MSRPESDSPRPTLRQIAARTGVSVMTVSRALRNSPLVTEPLRERIKKTAQKLGYRPDPELARLMKRLRRNKKSSYVATLAAISSVEKGMEPRTLLTTWTSAQARAEELGYRLELFRPKTPTEFNRQLQRTLVNRGIEGVLLLQMTYPSDVGALLDWEKFSVVAASPSVIHHAFPQVGANYYHNARLLCAELARRGCARIGFVSTSTFCVRTDDAFRVATAWHNLRAPAPPPAPLIASSRLPSRGELLAWLAREKPDGVIAHSPESAAFVAEHIAASGAPRPFLACTNVDPDTTRFPGVDERREQIGRNAVDLLAGLVARGEKSDRASPIGILVNGRWTEPR